MACLTLITSWQNSFTCLVLEYYNLVGKTLDGEVVIRLDADGRTYPYIIFIVLLCMNTANSMYENSNIK